MYDNPNIQKVILVNEEVGVGLNYYWLYIVVGIYW